MKKRICLVITDFISQMEDLLTFFLYAVQIYIFYDNFLKISKL